MRFLKFSIMFFLCLLSSGCNTIEHYNGKKPKMDFKNFFKGKVKGTGVIFDYMGRQIRSFKVIIDGTVDDNKLTMDEEFDFDDGEKQYRVWKVQFAKNNDFTATAGDVIGDATGRQRGNAVNLKYTLNIPYKDSSINLKMDDFMYMVTEKTILNRTKMKKFGVKVGEVIIFMEKMD